MDALQVAADSSSDDSSSDDSSSDYSSSGSSGEKSNCSEKTAAKEYADDSSAESDSGWSDTSGTSTDFLIGHTEEIANIEPYSDLSSLSAHQREDRRGLESNTSPNHVDHVKIDIIEKIILTRRRSLAILHGLNDLRNREHDGATSLEDDKAPESLAATPEKDRSFSPLAPRRAFRNVGELPPPPPSPPRSPTQPSPKCVSRFVDKSPKQPLRRSDSDDECDVDSWDSCPEDEENAIDPIACPVQNKAPECPLTEDPDDVPVLHDFGADTTCVVKPSAPFTASRLPPPPLVVADFPFINADRSGASQDGADLGFQCACNEQDGQDETQALSRSLLHEMRASMLRQDPKGDSQCDSQSPPKPVILTPRNAMLACALFCCLIMGAGLGVLLGATLWLLSDADAAAQLNTTAPTTVLRGDRDVATSPAPTRAPSEILPSDASQTSLGPSSSLHLTGAVAHSPILDAISAASSDGGAALRRFGSPQHRAYEWLLDQQEPWERNPRTGIENITKNDAKPVDFVETNIALRRIIQRYAMATLYYSTNGKGWNRQYQWMNASLDECFWGELEGSLPTAYNESVTNDTSRLLTSVALSHCQDDPDGATWLASLEFHDNNLVGSIPPQVGLLTNLRRLVVKQEPAMLHQDLIAERKLTGLVPSEFGSLGRLETLILNGHALAIHPVQASPSNATLPSELGNLLALRVLNLNDNKLSGNLPSFLERLERMQRLDLGGNSFQGNLPEAWANLQSLELLTLSHNELTGSLPGLLLTGISPSIRGFYLEHNKLTGSLPSELGLLIRLEDLHLAQNGLSGELPTELAALSNMTTFNVNNNQLRGTIPETYAGWTSVLTLQLHGNDLNGTVPAGLCAVLERNRRVSPWLSTSSADCPQEIACPCCQFCCTDDNECDVSPDASNGTWIHDTGSLLFREGLVDP